MFSHSGHYSFMVFLIASLEYHQDETFTRVPVLAAPLTICFSSFKCRHFVECFRMSAFSRETRILVADVHLPSEVD